LVIVTAQGAGPRLRPPRRHLVWNRSDITEGDSEFWNSRTKAGVGPEQIGVLFALYKEQEPPNEHEILRDTNT